MSALRAVAAGLALALLAACASLPRDDAALVAEVRATETAFARTMAERDFTAFERFIAPDAVFLSGPQPLRGAAAVGAYWKAFFTGVPAPFSWAPDQVQVLPSGTLALSSGPVQDAQGQPLGRFSSIWRRESSGKWRIVFDKGEDLCRCAATP